MQWVIVLFPAQPKSTHIQFFSVGLTLRLDCHLGIGQEPWDWTHALPFQLLWLYISKAALKWLPQIESLLYLCPHILCCRILERLPRNSDSWAPPETWWRGALGSRAWDHLWEECQRKQKRMWSLPVYFSTTETNGAKAIRVNTFFLTWMCFDNYRGKPDRVPFISVPFGTGALQRIGNAFASFLQPFPPQEETWVMLPWVFRGRGHCCSSR